MTNCCRKCSKLLCKDYGKIEDCHDCISYVLLAMKEIDKKLKEDYNDRVQSS
jgi:hypothetical protein